MDDARTIEGNQGAAIKGTATTIGPKALPYAGVSNDLNSIPRGEYKNIFKEHEPFLSTKLEYDSANGRYTSKVWKEVERNPGESISSYVNRRDASAIEGIEVLYAKKRREISDKTMGGLAFRLENGAYVSKEEMQAAQYGKPKIKAAEVEDILPLPEDIETTSLKQVGPSVKRIEDAGLTLKKHGDLSQLYDAAQSIRKTGKEGYCKHTFSDMLIHPTEEIIPSLENADYNKLIDFYTSADYDVFKQSNPEEFSMLKSASIGKFASGMNISNYLKGITEKKEGKIGENFDNVESSTPTETKFKQKEYSGWWGNTDRIDHWKNWVKQNHSWWNSRNSGYGWKGYRNDLLEKNKMPEVNEAKTDIEEYQRAIGGISRERLCSYKSILDYVRNRDYGPGKESQKSLTDQQFSKIMEYPKELDYAFRKMKSRRNSHRQDK